jgi:hypothetical protein
MRRVVGELIIVAGLFAVAGTIAGCATSAQPPSASTLQNEQSLVTLTDSAALIYANQGDVSAARKQAVLNAIAGLNAAWAQYQANVKAGNTATLADVDAALAGIVASETTQAATVN